MTLTMTEPMFIHEDTLFMHGETYLKDLSIYAKFRDYEGFYVRFLLTNFEEKRNRIAIYICN